jgi:hypothetical protein
MISIKKNRYFVLYALCALVALLLHTPSYTLDNQDENNSQTTSRFVDIFDDDPDDLLDIFIESSQTSGPPTRQITPETIVDALVKSGAIDILTEDFFLRTNPLNSQSLLDKALLGAPQCMCFDGSVLAFDLFFNQTSRANLSPDSTALCSYVALSQDSLINKLQNSVDQIKEIFSDPLLNIDINKIFSLFQNMRVQERRLGAMLYWQRAGKHVTAQFKVPFYYLERNLFLTDKERELVEAEFGALEPEEQEKFQKAHFISDKMGFGDARLEIEGLAASRHDFRLNAGGRLTLPTAFRVADSFMGSLFEKPCALPNFDFDELLDLANQYLEAPNDAAQKAVQEKAFALLSDFTLDALDRFAANLLDSKLGNDGHLGIGVFLHSYTPLSSFIKRRWATEIFWDSKLSAELLLPAKERRFYIQKNNKHAFLSRNFEDEEKAEDNLNFLEKEFVNRIYLQALNTHISSSTIISWHNKVCYFGKKWGITLGSDLWFKSKAGLGSIVLPLQCVEYDDLELLDRCKADPFRAYKASWYAGLSYKKKRACDTWLFSINGEWSSSHSGVGRDFTLSFKVESHF